MNAAVLLLRPRAFHGGKRDGAKWWCLNCTRDVHAHKKVACSSCGNVYRACLLGVDVTGFSACDEHRRSA